MSNDFLKPRQGPATPRLALRPREAAAAIGVSPRTLWDWTRRGEVPHVRRGGTILYPVSALTAWLDEQARRMQFPPETPPSGSDHDAH